MYIVHPHNNKHIPEVVNAVKVMCNVVWIYASLPPPSVAQLERLMVVQYVKDGLIAR